MTLPKQDSPLEWIMKAFGIMAVILGLCGYAVRESDRVTVLETNYSNIAAKLTEIDNDVKSTSTSVSSLDTKVNKYHDETICEFYNLQLMINPKEAVDPETHITSNITSPDLPDKTLKR